MAAGIVTKVVGDGNGGTISHRYWSPDTSANPQLLFPAPLIVDTSGTVIDWTSGTAGTPAGGVASVQGVAGMTPVSITPSGRAYETVAASQTAQVMGGSGATGDVFDGLLVIPATTSPGNVLILDNATSITVFTGGATSVSNLVPFWINLNSLASVSGAWKVTTGANVSVIGVGKFT